MRIVDMVPDAQYEIQQSDNALATALQQVSTGLRVNQLSDDPGASANMITSLAESANVDQYTKNITALQSQMQTADSSISTVVTALNSAITAGTSGTDATLSTGDRDTLASQVQGILSSVVSQANSQYQGAYIFGGSASSTPPFVQASTTYTSSLGSSSSPLTESTPLTAGSTTTISDATTGQSFTFKAATGDTIETLSAAMSSAVAAGTLSPGTTASVNASGELEVDAGAGSDGIVVSTNDAALGSMTAASGTLVVNSYAYVGNDTTNTASIGSSQSIGTNVSGSQIFGSGTNVLGSLTGLISALQSGTAAQISSATSAVTNALNSMSVNRMPLDNALSQMSSQETYLSQETVTLSTQQTALVGINLATAATNLSQAEQENSAVLGAAAKVLPQTLLQYLQP